MQPKVLSLISCYSPSQSFHCNHTGVLAFPQTSVLLLEDLYIWCSFCLKHSFQHFHYYSLIFLKSLFNEQLPCSPHFQLYLSPPKNDVPSLSSLLHISAWYLLLNTLHVFTCFLSISPCTRMDRDFSLFAHCWLKCLKSTWVIAEDLGWLSYFKPGNRRRVSLEELSRSKDLIFSVNILKSNRQKA